MPDRFSLRSTKSYTSLPGAPSLSSSAISASASNLDDLSRPRKDFSIQVISLSLSRVCVWLCLIVRGSLLHNRRSCSNISTCRPTNTCRCSRRHDTARMLWYAIGLWWPDHRHRRRRRGPNFSGGDDRTGGGR
jgi:hypothetical protein